MRVRLCSSRSRTSISRTCVAFARASASSPACLGLLVLVDGAKRAVGEEVVAAQAGVGVRAGLHERQAAVAVGQRLAWRGRCAPSSRPRPAAARRSGSAIRSPRMLMRSCQRRDLAAQRVVVQVGVAGGHLDRGVVEHLLDDRQRDAVVDHAGGEVVAKQVRVHPAGELSVAVADVGLADVALDDRRRSCGARCAARPPRPRGVAARAAASRCRRAVAVAQVLLLAAQLLGERAADRQHRFAAELVLR